MGFLGAGPETTVSPLVLVKSKFSFGSGDENGLCFSLRVPLGRIGSPGPTVNRVFSVEVRVNSDEKRTASEKQRKLNRPIWKSAEKRNVPGKTQNPTEK